MGKQRTELVFYQFVNTRDESDGGLGASRGSVDFSKRRAPSPYGLSGTDGGKANGVASSWANEDSFSSQ